MKKFKLDKVEVDFTLFIVILMLVFIGTVMIFSASSYVDLNDPNVHDMYFTLKKQIFWVVVGITAMVIVEKIDYHRYKKLTKPLMLLAIILLIGIIVAPSAIAPKINGAKRWFIFGPLSLQPSEIAKYTIVFYLALSIERKGEKMKSFMMGVLPYLIVSGAFAALILKEKNLSIATVIMAVTIIVLFIGGVNWKYLGGLILALVPVGFIFIKFESFRLKRFQTFLNPFADAKGTGYQLIQSWYALASGGLFGVGLGQSRQKAFYLPEAHNDFIFAIIGEELGLIGCVFVMALFLILLTQGVRTALKARDTYGMLLATGITAVIGIQTIINIAVVTGAIPVTGVPLPFISYGGTSLVMNLVAMGVLLNISSKKKR